MMMTLLQTPLSFRFVTNLSINICILVVLIDLPLSVQGGMSSKNNYQYLNVYGEELERCSTNGTALTGYTRNGYCIEKSDDTGSHHICINLNSTSGGNFCDVTGQSDWCSSTDMPCNDDVELDTSCAIENWCVCQWAFASYLQKAGGCDQIQEIECHAINMEAIRAYQTTYGYEQAFQCLVERCNLNPNTNFQRRQKYYDDVDATLLAWKRFAMVGFVVAIVATLWTIQRRSQCGQCGSSTSGRGSASTAMNEESLLKM